MSTSKKITVAKLRKMRVDGHKIVVLTAYDALFGRLADRAGVHVVLVGDSVGMTTLGYDSTVPVTLADMIHHTKAVVRGVERALVVADMPFMSCHVNDDETVRNAGRLMQEAGADAVKLEGGRKVAPTVARLVNCGVPVMGHVGLLPQSVKVSGGYRVHGRKASEAKALVEDALALEEAGAFAIVLESIPSRLGSEITEAVKVPTIGIGAGPGCSGQVQVSHDILGLFEEFVPKHTKRYAELGAAVLNVFQTYAQDVESQQFPGEDQSF